MQRIVIETDEETKLKLKNLAFYKRITMKDLFKKMIEDFLGKEKKYAK